MIEATVAGDVAPTMNKLGMSTFKNYNKVDKVNKLDNKIKNRDTTKVIKYNLKVFDEDVMYNIDDIIRKNGMDIKEVKYISENVKSVELFLSDDADNIYKKLSQEYKIKKIKNTLEFYS